MLTVLVVTFVGTVIIGIPVAFCLGLAALGSLVVWGDMPLYLIPQRMFTGIDSFLLMAIPFFMLAGELMSTVGILDRILKFADVLVGHIRGGLAHVNIVASMVFAGTSGSAVADTSAIGATMIPAMTRDGYSLDFSSGVTAGSSTIGPIIPPSIPMIIYAASTSGISVAALFLAGAIPGIMIGLGEIVIAYIIAVRRNYPYRKERLDFRTVLFRTWHGLPGLFMPVIVLGGILGGVFTPTEAGAMAVLYATMVGFFVTRQLKFSDIPRAMLRAGVTTSVVFLLIGTANGISWLLTTQQVPQILSAQLQALSSSPIVFLIIVNIFLLMVGCLMETAAALIMLVPILAPIADAFGVHPIHFGVIVVLNLVIGLVTPPVGACLFVACGIARISMERLVRAVMPFVIWQLVVLALVTYFPVLTVWLPTYFGY